MTNPLGLVLIRIRQRDGVGQLTGGECLNLLGAGQRGRCESRNPRPGGQQALQGLDSRLQLLRAPPRIRLPMLPISRLLLTLTARPVALEGPLLPLLVPLMLDQRPTLCLLLPLLLALRLSPDADQAVGPTTHALHALPWDDGVPQLPCRPRHQQ